MFLLEIFEVDTPTTRSIFWKFSLYSLDVIVFYLLPVAYIRGKFESQRVRNLIFVLLAVVLIVVLVFKTMQGMFQNTESMLQHNIVNFDYQI